jgi:large subunit ribosomal protein L19
MIIVLKKESDIVNLVEKITKSQIRPDLPEFRVGDTVKVDVRIVEGKRERIQAFEGIVMAIKGSGIGRNFIVRKMSSGVGVERTFPMNSPVVENITVVRKGKVRRAKLNYIRSLVKQAKIKERN